MTTTIYVVKGMTCDHCVRAVTREVSQVAGVILADVQLSSGELTVVSGGPVDDDAVRAAVDEAGYEIVE